MNKNLILQSATEELTQATMKIGEAVYKVYQLTHMIHPYDFVYHISLIFYLKRTPETAVKEEKIKRVQWMLSMKKRNQKSNKECMSSLIAYNLLFNNIGHL